MDFSFNRAGAWLLAAAGLAYLFRTVLTPANEAKLAKYPVATQGKFRALLAAFEARGYEVIVTSTVRTKDAPSRHATGRAIDLNVRKGGRQYFSYTPKAAWEATGLPALAKSMGFRWGGDFRTTPYDPVHFDC